MDIIVSILYQGQVFQTAMTHKNIIFLKLIEICGIKSRSVSQREYELSINLEKVGYGIIFEPICLTNVLMRTNIRYSK